MISNNKYNYISIPSFFVRLEGDYKMDDNEKLYFAINIFSLILLLIAVPDMPYGYYTLLRIAICLSALFNFVILLSKNNPVFGIIFVLIAVLFNPIILIAFEKDTWVIIDIITAGIYAVNIFVLYKIN